MTSEPNEQSPPAGDATPPVADPDPPGAGTVTDSSAVPGSDAEAEETTPDDDGSVGDEFTPEMIDALVAERDEFLDAYRRTAADFDNFRKLSQKRLADELTRSQGAFVERLLPVLDAIDAARTQGSDHVDAVASALFGFLEKEGLERVYPEAEPFDPNVAEAVVHEPGDHEHPIVSEVLRTGYLWQGRVLRPAMVKVSG